MTRSDDLRPVASSGMTTESEGNPYTVEFYRSHRVEAICVDPMSMDDIDTWLRHLGVQSFHIDRETPLVKVNGTAARKGMWIVAYDENDIRVMDDREFRKDYVREQPT